MHYHVSMTVLESGYYYYSNFTTQRGEMLGAQDKEVELEFDCLEEHMSLTVSYISIMNLLPFWITSDCGSVLFQKGHRSARLTSPGNFLKF